MPTRASSRQPVEQPGRANDARTRAADLRAKGTIGGHEDDGLCRDGSERDEGGILLATRVDDLHAISDALLHSSSRSALRAG